MGEYNIEENETIKGEKSSWNLCEKVFCLESYVKNESDCQLLTTA